MLAPQCIQCWICSAQVRNGSLPCTREAFAIASSLPEKNSCSSICSFFPGGIAQ